MHEAKTLLTVKQLSKSYGKKRVLNEVSFCIKQGDILGYIGQNGSGKTTTIKALCGLLDFEGGEVLTNFSNDKSNNYGVVLDGLGLHKRLTGWENLEYIARLAGMEKNLYMRKIESFMEKVNLLDVKDVVVKKYSKGMAKRLSIIMAVIHDPALLILDEPFDGIDTQSHYDLMKFLKEWVREDERAILFTSHNMFDVEALCNKVVIIDQGRIIENNSVEAMKRHDCEKKVSISFFDKIDEAYLLDSVKSLAQCTVYQQTLEIKEVSPDVLNKILLVLLEQKLLIKEVKYFQYSLEDVYLKKIGGIHHE